MLLPASTNIAANPFSVFVGGPLGRAVGVKSNAAPNGRGTDITGSPRSFVRVNITSSAEVLGGCEITDCGRGGHRPLFPFK